VRENASDGYCVIGIDVRGVPRDNAYRTIADHLPETASYVDAMYELYVRMKIARGMEAAEQGRVAAHDKVKRRFAK